MLSKPLRLPLLLLSVAVLAACSSDGDERPEYQGAKYYKSLEIPPDLTLQKTREEMVIPQPSHSALTQYQVASKLDQAVLPEFEGIRLKSDGGGLYWLEMDAAPDTVWPKLEAFWEHEGIRLLQDEPLLGFMETEWSSRLVVDPDAGFLTRMFSKMEPDLLDRFRMRVESDNDRKRTKVFVSHAGMERFVEGGDEDSRVIWRRRPSDPNLEREILGRLVLFAGLNENQKESLLKNYHPYQSYVHYAENVSHGDEDQPSIDKDAGQVAELTMQGSMDFVWQHTLRALDRLALKDIKADRAAGTIGFTSGSDIEMTQDEEHRDELAESSWLMKLLRGSDETKQVSQQFTLKLTDQGGKVRLDLLDTRGAQADTARAQQIRQALAQELD
jgi:outer membrane protein assembly factor BamC